MMREMNDFCEEPAILVWSVEVFAMPYLYRKGRLLEGCSQHSWALEERVQLPAAQCTSGCSTGLLMCRRSQASALNLGVRRMCTVVCASVGGILGCLAEWRDNVTNWCFRVVGWWKSLILSSISSYYSTVLSVKLTVGCCLGCRSVRSLGGTLAVSPLMCK